MWLARVGQPVHRVHLCLRKAVRRWVDDDAAITVPLNQPPGVQRVGFAVQQSRRACEGDGIFRYLFVARELDRLPIIGGAECVIFRKRFILSEQVGHAAQSPQVADALAEIEALCDLEDRSLAGSEGDEVGFGADQAARHHPIRPIVVVRDPA
jgi:hypothetical protein